MYFEPKLLSFVIDGSPLDHVDIAMRAYQKYAPSNNIRRKRSLPPDHVDVAPKDVDLPDMQPENDQPENILCRDKNTAIISPEEVAFHDNQDVPVILHEKVAVHDAAAAGDMTPTRTRSMVEFVVGPPASAPGVKYCRVYLMRQEFVTARKMTDAVMVQLFTFLLPGKICVNMEFQEPALSNKSKQPTIKVSAFVPTKDTMKLWSIAKKAGLGKYFCPFGGAFWPEGLAPSVAAPL